jgi:prolyl 4-hydroxylase
MASTTISARFTIADDFLAREVAQGMRGDIDAHFADPDAHRPESHQVWNYWYVPGAYTYLRTQPEKVISANNIAAFVDALQRWSAAQLGLTGVSWPYLSLYVDGCSQVLHNDSMNGRFGYVYSLTLADRKTIGGETIVLHEGDLFRNSLSDAAAGLDLFDLVEPVFNRLVVFDDRVPHGVQRVEGSMDPREGRLVLHGHISDAGPTVIGALPAETVNDVVQATALKTVAADSSIDSQLHGLIVPRIQIGASGAVEGVTVLVDRLARRDGASCEALVEALVKRIAGLRFSAASATTDATIPIAFGSRPSGDQGPAVSAAVSRPAKTKEATGDGEAEEAKLRAKAAVPVRRTLAKVSGLRKLPVKDLEMYAMKDFLSEAECARLIELIDAGKFPSGLLADEPDEEFRTSDSCHLDRNEPVVRQVEAKFDALTGIEAALGETIQGQRYAVGQRFKPHHDYFHVGEAYWQEQQKIGGQRTWTGMVFLNKPEAGGKTNFPSAQVAVSPTTGTLLLWNNLEPSGAVNPKSLHEGMPVDEGLKYIITKWYRERPWG